MTTLRTATKEQLIEALQELPDGAHVAFSSDYGDYIHTQQIHTLRGETDCVAYGKSAYSKSGFAVNDFADDDYNGDVVYILS